MNKTKIAAMGWLLAMMVAGSTACRQNSDIDFAYGADPSWITEMEAEGEKFYDKDGKETECMELLRGIGFNAVRLRVFVDPGSPNGYGGQWCAKDDVVTKAKRAANLGYKIMIGFHYSDNWADPGQQRKPRAWDNLETIDELADAAANHTRDVLKAIRDEGIDVKWIQIGNETSKGLFIKQSDGVTDSKLHCRMDSTGIDNYITVHNKCRKAAKEIFPDGLIVVQFDQGHNWNRYGWGMENLAKRNVEFDILGMSGYLYVDHLNWEKFFLNPFVENLKRIATEYNKDVMICETGTFFQDTYKARRAIWNLVTRCRTEIPRCKGVFYWEPQCYNWKGYTKGGFLSTRQPAGVLDIFDGKPRELLPEDDPDQQEVSASDSLKLQLYDRITMEHFAECIPDSNGIWRARVTTKQDWYGFKAIDGKGTQYGSLGWMRWNKFQKYNGDNMWFDKDIAKAGTYDIWLDPNTGNWGGSPAAE